jgi:hypothetical protein
MPFSVSDISVQPDGMQPAELAYRETKPGSKPNEGRANEVIPR